jgi:hypothetical protein
VLLARGQEGEWLFPLQSDTAQLFGWVLDEKAFSSEADEWIACEPWAWSPGKIPIIQSKDPFRIEFIDPLEVERRRRREASFAIVSAFHAEPSSQSLLKRVALIEHADRILGGHVLSVAALLALRAQSHEPDAIEFGSYETLRERLREAAPSGTASLPKVWASPGFERVRDESTIREAITDVIAQTFAEHDLLKPGQWQNMRALTLWSWWLRSRLASEKITPREFAKKLAVNVDSVETLLRGEMPADEQLRKSLPTEEVALRQIGEATKHSQAPHTIASMAEAHRPRLNLMASQMAELERLLGRTHRLSRWERVRSELSEIANSVDPVHLGGLEDWQRAQIAAQDVRQLLREGVGGSFGEALPLGCILEGAALRLLGAILPYERLLGEWAVGTGAAPVIGVSPSVTESGIGVLRFAVAHQLGHLIESLGGHPTSICTHLEKGDVMQSGEGERFANAFAAYLLAPRDAVQRLIGSHHRRGGWYWDAALDVASVFGMSPGAAMPHLLNCLGESNAKQLLEGFRQDSHWAEYRERVRDHVEARWNDDRIQAVQEVGEQPHYELREALRRPRSTVFDLLVSEAAAEGLLNQETIEDLKTA